MSIKHVRRLDPGVFVEESEMTLPALSLRNTRQLLTTLLILTLIFLFSACAKRAHHENLSKANDQRSRTSETIPTSNQAPKRININTASAEELEQLPGIGKALAGRIIEHREKYGPFRRPEHLIVVRGVSDRKFRALRDLVTVE